MENKETTFVKWALKLKVISTAIKHSATALYPSNKYKNFTSWQSTGEHREEISANMLQTKILTNTQPLPKPSLSSL